MKDHRALDEAGHPMLAEALPRSLRNLIADDGYACTFQTIGQYRTALLKAFDTVSGWRPIDTAPHDGTPVLLFARAVFATAPVRVIGWWISERGWIECAFAPNSPVGLVPTHWMPLPTVTIKDA